MMSSREAAEAISEGMNAVSYLGQLDEAEPDTATHDCLSAISELYEALYAILHGDIVTDLQVSKTLLDDVSRLWCS